MNDFIVTGIPGSPYLRSALLALEEKGMAWQLRPLAFGENGTPEYRRRHPFGKIPAFEFDGMHFYETQAMMRFVDRVGPGPSLTPADPRSALVMDQLMNIVDDYIRKPVSGDVSFPLAVGPLFGMPADYEAVRAAVPAAQIAISEVARLLGAKQYMAGETVSLADLMLISHLEFLRTFEIGLELLEPHPALTSWIGRMADRPSFSATAWDRLSALAEQKSAA